MATAALIPLAQYLATTYRPDCDYIDGELKEESVGRNTAFRACRASCKPCSRSIERRGTFARFPSSGSRLPLPASACPTSCAIRPDGPPGGILRTPPVVCIEILSRGDTLADMQERIDDYVTFGVANIWLIDPVSRRALDRRRRRHPCPGWRCLYYPQRRPSISRSPTFTRNSTTSPPAASRKTSCLRVPLRAILNAWRRPSSSSRYPFPSTSTRRTARTATISMAKSWSATWARILMPACRATWPRSSSSTSQTGVCAPSPSSACRWRPPASVSPMSA